VPFLCNSAFCSFSLITGWLCIFLRKTIGAKAARKILMKLTTGQSKLGFGDLVLSSSQFLILFQLPQKRMLASKVIVKGSKTIISLS